MALLQPGAEVEAPSSRSYNAGFDSPAAGLAALSIVGPILALALVSNRIYWRLKNLGKVWYDDWCIIISLVGVPAVAECRH